jgi:hypothetical protein
VALGHADLVEILPVLWTLPFFETLPVLGQVVSDENSTV